MLKQEKGSFLLLLLLATGFMLLSISIPLYADIALPKLFSDHMVLQQNQSMRISGTADSEEKLTVSFVGKSVDAQADSNGRWSAVISTGPAGGPYQLEVASRDSETKVVFNDVLVGEVWICGGQSNMRFPISKSSNAESDIAAAKNHPGIRIFDVEQNTSLQPLKEFAKVDSWFCCSPESIKEFSAVAYLFGRELNKKLEIPIGLINVSRDSTTLEAWSPYDTLKSDGSFSQLLNHWEERAEPDNPNRVSSSFNGMVSPLAGFAFRGIVWYQGEANIGRGAQYRRMFPLMINAWREKLGQRNCPFYFVQPAPYRYKERSPEALPEIWDAQLKTLMDVPNTGMVVTTDLGDPEEQNPQKKLPVAQRLSRWALADCYSTFIEQRNKTNEASTSGSETDQPQAVASVSGELETRSQTKPACPSGPLFESAIIAGNRIVVSFHFADSKLKINEDIANQFAICGPDKKFVPAQVEVDGSKLVIFHPEISEPLAMRYNWTDTALPSLINNDGLPASPFRTDSFPLQSEGVEF